MAVMAAPPPTILRKSLRFIGGYFFEFIGCVLPAHGLEALDVVVHRLSEGRIFAGALSPEPQNFRQGRGAWLNHVLDVVRGFHVFGPHIGLSP